MIADTLADVLGRFRILSEDEYRVDGVVVRHDPGRARFFSPASGYPAVVAEVAQAIYDRAYTNGDEGRGAYVALPDRNLQQIFAERLARADASRHSWVPGYRLAAVEGDRLRVVGSDGEERFVTPEEFDGASVLFRKGSPLVQPGWFHVRGERDHAFVAEPTVRVYWNVCAAGAGPLVRSVTRRLNAADLAFHFKILDDPQGFRRADSAVLYLPAASWPRAASALRDVHTDVRVWLKPRTPLFTLRLAPGVAVAEDPGNRESFGMNRARLVAEALWDARASPDEDVPAALAARFRREGVPPDRPWLREGSNPADYGLRLEAAEVPTFA